jgi:SNF2 family DNA or RNA helicase
MSCLLADDMGHGKTVRIVVLFLLNPLPAPILVVMPASIITN